LCRFDRFPGFLGDEKAKGGSDKAALKGLNLPAAKEKCPGWLDPLSL